MQNLLIRSCPPCELGSEPDDRVDLASDIGRLLCLSSPMASRPPNDEEVLIEMNKMVNFLVFLFARVMTSPRLVSFRLRLSSKKPWRKLVSLK